MLLGGAERFDRRLTRCVDFTGGNIHRNNTTVNPASFTACVWINKTSNVIGPNFSLFTIDDNTSYVGLGTSSGATIDVYTEKNSFAGSVIFTPTNGLWYFVALQGQAAQTLGWSRAANGPLSAATVYGQFTALAANTGHFGLGNDSGGAGAPSDFPGLIAGLKVWQYQLSAAEIAAESYQLAPLSQRGLEMYVPLRGSPGDAQDDEYLRGRPWTTTGTLARSNLAPPVPEVLWPRRFTWFDVSPPPPAFTTDPPHVAVLIS